MNRETTHCGYVAIIGRPNVGKSTLLNKILGQKLSIVSPKPQTTRQQILGINTINNMQIIYVDTPGLHQHADRAMNRLMNRTAGKALIGVDAIIFMVEALVWKADDEWVLRKLTDIASPVILVVNKVDKIKDKSQLLPYIQKLSEKYNFADMIPVSAYEGTQIMHLEEIVNRYMPEGPFIFPVDQVTDRSQRFLAAEIIREKLLYYMQQEIPYSITVEIEQFEMKENVLHLSAVIWVEKDSQKKIVIGAKGERLKKVGTEARIELEKNLESKIYLRLRDTSPP